MKPARNNLHREDFIGVLNGVFGDKFVAEQSPLAINMGFYSNGRRLDLSQSIRHQIDGVLTSRVVILIHGLTNTESVWDLNPESSERIQGYYGAQLAQQFLMTPFHVRYNTGLSVEHNGQQLVSLIEDLFEAYPIEIDQLVIVGFSMGGLLARFAQHVLPKNIQQTLAHCIYLGVPHEGAPLEKFGHALGQTFGLFNRPHFKVWQSVLDIRSAGIKDLRHGFKYEDYPFDSGIQHMFISGSVGPLVGDGLVCRNSAAPPDMPNDAACFHIDSADHFTLAHSPSVYHCIQQELSKFTLKRRVKILQTDCHEAKVLVDDQAGSFAVDLEGFAGLALDVFDVALDTTQVVHDSISKDVYDSVRYVPLGSLVRNAHEGIAKTVFSSLNFSSTVGRKALTFGRDRFS